MGYKRLRLARIVLATGLHRAWSGAAPASLIIFNYHRLRPATESGPSRFDDGVFGPDAAVFRRQMQWLKDATEVLDEEGLISLTRNADRPRGVVYSAVTFDDAYVDCHTIARPILDELGIRAIFFVPIGMIEARRLGWWDQAAYLLKASKQDLIQVRDEEFNLRTDFRGALRRVLKMFKLEPAARTEGLLDELSSACHVALPSKDLQSAELMSWEQIRGLRDAGHNVGSHSLSHRVLATLSPEQQAVEIGESRKQLAVHVGAEVRSFAYPVGGLEHINSNSVALAEEAGYELAFTFNTGMETLPIEDRFRIRRESAHTFELLEAKVLMPSLMGIRLKRAI